MKKYLSALFAFLMFSTGYSQYTAVEFNYEKSLFNNGKPLPAESYFELQGDVPPSVQMVEVSLFSEHGYPEDKPLYSNSWTRPFNNQTQRFQLPINYKLHSSREYDLLISYFEPVEESNRRALQKELQETLAAYLTQHLSYDRKRINLLKDEGRMVEEMNDIVRGAFKYYRTPLHGTFTGFSDLVEDQIEAVEDQKQSSFLGKKTDQQTNLELKKELVEKLKTRVFSELSYLFNGKLYKLTDQKHIDDYLTEDVQQFFTLHGGYGGSYIYDPSEDYGRGFIAGVTLPLANEELSTAFWSRTSIMAGVYFNNFELDDRLEATGPLLGRPYYLGLGYKFYRFLRLSAGGVILQDQLRDGASGPMESEVYLRPYLSLTADINLFIGLAK